MKVQILILISICIILTACQQLMNGQQQPVRILRDNLMMTTCGGVVETWGSCNNRAMERCSSGYEVIKKNEDSTGMVRELVFKCKK